MEFAVHTDDWGKMKERERIDKYLDLAWEPKKTVEHEGDDDDISCSWRSLVQRPKHRKETGVTRDQRNDRYHADYSTDKIN